MHDVVTNIITLRRGWRVTVNDQETINLSHAEMRAFPLIKGEPFDFETYKQNLLLHQYPMALNRAVGLLALRARSTTELARRLHDHGYLPETIEMVLYKLEHEKLTDDAAFAKTWVEQRAARGLGKARLLQELRVKGIQDDHATAALDALDTETTDAQAMQLAMKLLKRHGALSAQEKRRKAIAAMQRRGYGYGEAARALSAADAESETSVDMMDDDSYTD